MALTVAPGLGEDRSIKPALHRLRSFCDFHSRRVAAQPGGENVAGAAVQIDTRHSPGWQAAACSLPPTRRLQRHCSCPACRRDSRSCLRSCGRPGHARAPRLQSSPFRRRCLDFLPAAARWLRADRSAALRHSSVRSRACRRSRTLPGISSPKRVTQSWKRLHVRSSEARSRHPRGDRSAYAVHSRR